MLVKGPKQTKLVFSPSIYSELIHEDHFLRELDKCIDWSRIEAAILPLYCKDNGRPVTNIPRRMFKAEVLQFMYDWSDRKMIEHGRYNILVKWFLELGIDEEPFDFTALSKFRAKLGVKLHTELFLDILEQIDAAGFLDFKDQFIDATSILGDVAVCSTTQLISKACTHLARNLEEEGHPVSFEEEKKSLQKVAEKASHLLETADTIPGAEHEREILQSILSDYTECLNGVITERKKKGSDRIVSLTDEDVRWGAKSDKKTWPGYKLHNMMTENRFITSVIVTPGNVTDDKEAVPLFEQQEKKPETVTGDGSYGTGENRLRLKKEGCQLIAPLRGQENKTKLYPKSKFLWDGEKVTCPGGKTTSTFYDNKRAKCYVYQFTGSDCEACPLKSECTTCLRRTIAISYYQSLFDEAEEFNKTDAYKEHKKKRAHIEPKYSEMKHIHGMERARYRGLERVTIQALLTAIVVNLKNFIRLLREAAQNPSQRELSIPRG